MPKRIFILWPQLLKYYGQLRILYKYYLQQINPLLNLNK